MKNYRKQYCSIITFNSKFMYEFEVMGQRPETSKLISDLRPLISPTNQPNHIL